MSRLCKTIDVKVQVFLDPVIKGEGPYIWIDATDTDVRGAVGSFLSQPSIGTHLKPLATVEIGARWVVARQKSVGIRLGKDNVFAMAGETSRAYT